MQNRFLSAYILQSSLVFPRLTLMNGESTSLNDKTELMIWKWMCQLTLIGLCVLVKKMHLEKE